MSYQIVPGKCFGCAGLGDAPPGPPPSADQQALSTVAVVIGVGALALLLYLAHR